MKHLSILFIIFSLLIASPLYAQVCRGQHAGVVGGGGTTSCSGVTQQAPTDMVAEDNGTNVGLAAATTVITRATQFVYTGTTGTLCRFDAAINCATTNCTQILTGKIFQNNATPDPDTPGSLLGTCSGTVDTASIETSNVWVSFTNCAISLTNGSTYWVAITADSASGTNHLHWVSDSTCTTELAAYADTTPTWTSAAMGFCLTNKLYILE